MEREIKFRAWNRGAMAMLNDPNVTLSGISKILHMDFMQYAGMKDKNGKDIYEGDIVVGKKGDFISDVIGRVVYLGLAFCFEGIIERPITDSNIWLYTVTSTAFKQLNDIEIVGNVYENPDLLKSLEK